MSCVLTRKKDVLLFLSRGRIARLLDIAETESPVGGLGLGSISLRRICVNVDVEWPDVTWTQAEVKDYPAQTMSQPLVSVSVVLTSGPVIYEPLCFSFLLLCRVFWQKALPLDANGPIYASS